MIAKEKKMKSSAWRSWAVLLSFSITFLGCSDAQVEFENPFSSLSTEVVEFDLGDRQACAVMLDGTVRCWGESVFSSPDFPRYKDSVWIKPMKEAVQVAVGDDFACALDRIGQVTCWGSNYAGQLGRAGDQFQGSDSSLPKVAGLVGVRKIEAGGAQACALVGDNRVLCWGQYTECLTPQAPAFCGDPNFFPGHGGEPAQDLALSSSLKEVPGFSAGDFIEDLAVAPSHACAVIRDMNSNRRAHCWGFAQNGRLGAGSLVSSHGYQFGNVATEAAGVTVLQDVAEVKVGFAHGCARTTTGEIWCWGQNYSGQIGDASLTRNTYMPGYPGYGESRFAVRAIYNNGGADAYTWPVLTGATKLAAGQETSCSVDAAQQVLCWGAGQTEGVYGVRLERVVDAARTVRQMPAPVRSLKIADRVVCALVEGGALFCWGHDRSGLITGRTPFSEKPQLLRDASGGPSRLDRLAAFADISCGLQLKPGSLGFDMLCWGSNRDGRMGQSDPALFSAMSPIPILSSAAPGQATGLSTGDRFGCVVFDGRVFCVGENYSNQRGEFNYLMAKRLDALSFIVNADIVDIYQVKVDDVDGDGKTDVLVLGTAAPPASGAVLAWYEMNLGWSLVAKMPITVNQSSRHEISILALPLDDLGAKEIIVAHPHVGGGGFSMVRLDNLGENWTMSLMGSDSGFLGAGQFDADIPAEVAVLTAGTIQIKRWSGTSLVTNSGGVTGVAAHTGTNGDKTQVVDLNGDGLSDVVEVYADAGATYLRTYMNAGASFSSGLALQIATDVSGVFLKGVAALELDPGLAGLEILTVSEGSGNFNLQAFSGDLSQLSWQASSTTTYFGDISKILLNDVDADGELDLLLSNPYSYSKMVLPGKRLTTGPLSFSLYAAPTSLPLTWGSAVPFGPPGPGGRQTWLVGAGDRLTFEKVIGTLPNVDYGGRLRLVHLEGEDIKVEKLTSGREHSCALAEIDEENLVPYCWGQNSSGQLGRAVMPSSGPAPVEGLPVDFRPNNIATSSERSCIVGNEGGQDQIYCWGANAQSGITYQPVPTQVAGITGPAGAISDLAVSSMYACAILSGKVYCWGGFDAYGPRGLIGGASGESYSAIPIAVSGLSDSPAQQITLGHEHGCSLHQNGEIWCWGSRDRGRLGGGLGVNKWDDPTPIKVPLPTGAIELRAGERHTCARFNDQSVMCWGDNSFNQIGMGPPSVFGELRRLNF